MLTGITRRLTADEKAREPRDLGVVAYFDGWGTGVSGVSRQVGTYARRLTYAEAACWRDGYREGRRERVCHAWHGFLPCDHAHPDRLPRDDEGPSWTWRPGRNRSTE